MFSASMKRSRNYPLSLHSRFPGSPRQFNPIYTFLPHWSSWEQELAGTSSQGHSLTPPLPPSPCLSTHPPHGLGPSLLGSNLASRDHYTHLLRAATLSFLPSMLQSNIETGTEDIFLNECMLSTNMVALKIEEQITASVSTLNCSPAKMPTGGGYVYDST